MPQLIDTEELTIRLARPGDGDALARLAQRDSAPLPASPALLAFSGERLMAAVSLSNGQTVADPFEHTLAIVEVLRARAGHLDGRGTGLLGRLLRRPAPQPAPEVSAAL